MRGATSDPAAMNESSPMTAPSSTMLPMPTSTREPMVQPWMTAECPTVTSSPRVVAAWPAVMWTTTLSCRFDRAPTRMG